MANFNSLKHILRNNGYLLSIVWKSDCLYFILRCIMACINGLMPVAIVVFPKIIIDEITGPKRPTTVVGIIVIFGLIQLLYHALSLGINFYYDYVASYKINRYLNDAILRKMGKLDVSFFEHPSLYDLYAKAKAETGNRTRTVISTIFDLISTGITSVSTALLLWRLNPLFVALVVVVVFVMNQTSSIKKRMSFDINQKMVSPSREVDYCHRLVVEPQYCKEIRLYNISEWIIKKYEQAYMKIYRIYSSYLKACTKLDYLGNVCLRVEDAIIYVILSFKVMKGLLKIGDFSMYSMAVQKFTECIYSISEKSLILYENSLYTQNIIAFLELNSKITCIQEHPEQIPVGSYEIEFNKVSFRYPGQKDYALRNISFKITNRTKVLLVGKNGSGKTTIIKLLTRLYDPEEGQILLNGIDIRCFDVEDYRNLYSTVFQDFNEYAFSIAENILMRDYTTEDKDLINEALKTSGLDQKITTLPQGIHTPISKEFDAQGTELSGGENQKIAIARAYARKTPLLVLDEPTSALDPLAEFDLYESLIKLSKDRTCFFVSHRLSCATLADMIIVVNDGMVKEIGTHKELMILNGLYKHMFTTQAAAYITKDSSVSNQ